ncbi:potassium voltage-gated channel subfamily G member 4a [Stegostoma tigrinum]|uniref:potassium voltage-gated channel subfamily G member 4a n=1 Tax=Stegostoma tigrinum TaxID=3053191 RepID=UPI00202B9B75|nr:potassium voltage-gated channel subfamily G member 4a [Stegostoma tigrinum]XP_059507732.1 potassium voltage-gated channel subfamily G member 4a [Stegostoma tigrinum]
MPIISRSSDNDYSNLSDTSCSSLNHIVPVSHSEVPPVKGVFYRRCRRIQQRGGLSDTPRHRQRHLIVNVGGSRYLLPWSTLDAFPLTRLGRLRFCRSREEIVQICDDYDESTHEFFFDRNPCAFRMILTFISAGKLRLLREMCALSFQEELLYWGLEEGQLEWCCRRKLLLKVRELAEIRRGEDLEADKEKASALADGTKLGYCMEKLRDMVENPQSGIPGKVFACLSIIFVTITVISICISTVPELRTEEERDKCSQRCYNMFIIETICVAWFSLEFVLRFIQARSKWQFLRSPLNIIDILAILPYYVALVVDKGPADSNKPSGSNIHLEKLGLVLRILRALRILYVMRLARHSLGLQTLGLTVHRSIREFGLLLLFLCVSVTLFAPLVFLAENEMGKGQDFSSIPASYWWAIISMTTVGYGDMVPRTIPGQVIALSSILSGILIMAFPATSIFHAFSRAYLELKQEQEKAQARLKCIQKAATQAENEELSDTKNASAAPDC